MTISSSQNGLDRVPASLTIPKDSYTAFRLMYAPADEICELSKCVFLGKIPPLWWAGEQTGIVGRIVSKFKSEARRSLDSTTQLFSDALRSASGPKTGSKASRIDELEFQARYNKSSEAALRSLYGQMYRLQKQLADGTDDLSDLESDEDEMEHNSFIGAVEEPGSNRLTPNAFSSPQMSENHMGSILEPTSTQLDIPLQYIPPESIHSESSGKNLLLLDSLIDGQNPPSNTDPFLPIFDSHPSLNGMSYPTTKVSLVSTYQPQSSTAKDVASSNESPLVRINTAHPLEISTKTMANVEPKVKFEVSNNLPYRSRVSFAHPIPEADSVRAELHKEYVKMKNPHFKRFGRLQKIASKSKRHALKTSHKVRAKVSMGFLKRYKVGDILRIDRMLVTVNKESLEDTSVPSQSPRTETRLNEFYVVLRKGKSLTKPLVVQLFNTELYGDFSGKPVITLNLGRGDSVQIYSTVEKSFKVTEEREGFLRVFIFIPRFAKLSFMWMFLVQTILGDNHVPIMSIAINGTDVSINVPLSRDLLSDLSSNHDNELKLSILNRGYKVKYDFVIDYLLKSVKNALTGMVNPQCDLKQWASESDDTWLCFKFFDRLEWVPNDTDLFLIQHYIQCANSQLEVRRKTRIPLSIMDSNHEDLSQPYPIEGFLSRITNTSGEEYSNLRAFYKIQYFHTTDNLLLFSKLFMSVPPSPGNILLKATVSKTDLNMPEVYLRSPFQTDDFDHIPWLDSPEFENFDREAVVEFKRRVQQITRADAVVDLCAVEQICPLSLQDILKHHLYFQSLFWHSSSVIIDDESLIDCGFEIILTNGGTLKLLASSRFIRDEWISRLQKLVRYWRAKKTAETEQLLQIKEMNLKKFEIKEHIDTETINILQSFFSLSAKPNGVFDSRILSIPTNLIKSGYVYNKLRKHTEFSQRFVLLCPGYLIIFKLFKRSKATGVWKQLPCFERYLTLPLATCYVYSGELTKYDLLDERGVHIPGEEYTSRFYPDGWKSSEEDYEKCFTVWFGKKRALNHSTKFDSDIGNGKKSNPGLVKMIQKLGFTGKRTTFMCRSRQERESWTYAISSEIDRLSLN